MPRQERSTAATVRCRRQTSSPSLREFADRHIGPAPSDDVATMPTSARPSRRRCDANSLAEPPVGPGGDAAASHRASTPAAGRHRGASGSPSCARWPTATPSRDVDDRAGLLRHADPAGGAAQRAGEPGLVHRLHAVPAGDQPGPARGAAELPDRGRRPHRAADRRTPRCSTRHRGRRGDDADAPRRTGRAGRRARSSTPTCSRRPSPCCAPAPSRSASRSSPPTCATGCPDGEFFGVLVQLPRRQRRGASTWSRSPRPPTSAARWSRSAADLLALTLVTPPGSAAPTSPSAPPSASACRWASAVRTPATWRCAAGLERTCRAGWSACPSTPTARRRTGWRCRPASSTSAATRRPPTSAPPRCCWR